MEDEISYRRVEILTEHIYQGNHKLCMEIVEEMFEQFPKENDCITSIILTSLEDEIKTYNELNLVRFLKCFLEYLKNIN